MTPARMQHLGGAPSSQAVLGDGEASGPRVRDDMTVEVALSLMAGARVDHLVLCDEDDRGTGLMTLARLAVLRGSPAYTDRIRLRDVLDGSFTSSALRSGRTGTAGGTAFREV